MRATEVGKGHVLQGPPVKEDWFYPESVRRPTVQFKQREDQIYTFDVPLLVAVEIAWKG